MLDDRNERRKMHNEESYNTATMHKQSWNPADEQYLLDNTNIPTMEAAIELGRTYEAIQIRRYRVRALKTTIAHSSYTSSPKSATKILTLAEAVTERQEQLDAGVLWPTITSVPGGYVVKEMLK